MEEPKRYRQIPQTQEYKQLINEAREKIPASLEVTSKPKKEARKHVAVYLDESTVTQIDRLVYEYKVQNKLEAHPTRSSVIADIIHQYFAKNL